MLVVHAFLYEFVCAFFFVPILLTELLVHRSVTLPGRLNRANPALKARTALGEFALEKSCAPTQGGISPQSTAFFGE
jgi:hypothetical protein